jgi:hypothetical protein
MITEGLIKLVKAEATALMIYATEDERSKIQINRFDPIDWRRCIYGLMTNCCDSYRAVRLLDLCTQPFSRSATKRIDPLDFVFANGMNRDFSPIEFYINQEGAKNANLINYLNGTLDTLDL